MRAQVPLGRVVTSVSVALALGACDAPSPAARPSTDTALTAWTLAETPEFVTAADALSGDSVQFFRINAAAFDRNGDAVLAAGGDVVYLDGDGTVSASLGRAGTAPGEFRSVGNVFVVGEHVAVWDPQSLRVTLFRDRVLEEAIPLRIPSRDVVVGLFTDGTIVTTRNPGFAVFATADSVVEEGTPTRYDLWDRRGNHAGTLEGAPAIAAPYFRFVHRREGSAIFSTDLHGGTCLPEIEQLVGGDRILIADGKRGVLYALHRSGELTELMRETSRGTVGEDAVTRVRQMIEDTESYVEPVLDDAEQAILAQVGEVGDPLPSAWSAMLQDPEDGSIWLRRAACFPEDPTETWDVVDAEGRPTATVTVPGNLRTLSVVGDRVLGVLRDEQGVEKVALFRVQK